MRQLLITTRSLVVALAALERGVWKGPRWLVTGCLLAALLAPGAASAAQRPSREQPADRAAGARLLSARSGYARGGGSERVRAVQRRLRALGYATGPVDGLFGPLTAGAVRAFQRARGLRVDGVVGPRTRRRLVRRASAGTPRRRRSRSDETRSPEPGPASTAPTEAPRPPAPAAPAPGRAGGSGPPVPWIAIAGGAAFVIAGLFAALPGRRRRTWSRTPRVQELVVTGKDRHGDPVHGITGVLAGSPAATCLLDLGSPGARVAAGERRERVLVHHLDVDRREWLPLSSFTTAWAVGSGSVSGLLVDDLLPLRPNGQDDPGQAPAAELARPEAQLEDVSVVIPVRNEAKNIGWVLDRLPRTVGEVILVDGRSTDDTVRSARAAWPELNVVQERERGKGGALRTGFDAARQPYVVMIDADGSMDPSELRSYVEPLRAGADMTKGSRYLPGGGSSDISRRRNLGNRLLVLLTNLLFRVRHTDLCYGYQAFRRESLRRLGLDAPGFEIETQIIARAIKAGLRIVEVPSFESPRRHGESNLHAVRDGLRVLMTLLAEWRTRREPSMVLRRRAETPVTSLAPTPPVPRSDLATTVTPARRFARDLDPQPERDLAHGVDVETARRFARQPFLSDKEAR